MVNGNSDDRNKRLEVNRIVMRRRVRQAIFWGFVLFFIALIVLSLFSANDIQILGKIQQDQVSGFSVVVGVIGVFLGYYNILRARV